MRIPAPGRWPIAISTVASAAFAFALALTNPAAALNYVEDAQQYLRNGDVKSAVIQLRNAVRDQPNDPKIRALLAEAYLRGGNVESAEREARAARERKGDEADYLPILAEALLQQARFADVVGQVKPGERAPAVESKLRLALGAANIALHHREEAEPLLRDAVRLDPNSTRAKIVLARFLAGKDVKEADQIIDEVLATTPQLADAIEVKGVVLQAMGDHDGAVRRFDEVVKLAPGNRAARLSRAAINLERDNYTATDEDLDPLLKANAKDPQANYLRARERTKQKKFAEADQVLDRISFSFESMWEGYYLQGAVKAELGQYAQAENLLAKYAARVPQDANAPRLAAIVALRQGAATRAIGYLKPLTDRAPQDAMALGLLGNAYMAADKPDLALEQFQKAATIDPDNPTTGTGAALAEIRSGKGKAGIADLERVFDSGSGAAVAGPPLVLAQLRAGQLDKAAATAAKLVGDNPKNMIAQSLLGFVKFRQGDNAGAETALRAALTLQPASGAAATNLAHLYIATGRSDEAANTYNDLLAKKPDDLNGLLGLAEVAIAQQKWDQAADYLKRAQTAAPTNPVPSIRLVNLYLLRRDFPQAKATADQAANQFAANADVLEAQGRAQFATGDSKSAVSTYRRAYQLAPNSDQITTRYLALLVTTKNLPEARTVLQQAIERNPNNATLKVDAIRLEAELSGIDAGVAMARRYAEADPEHVVYDVVAAELYEKAGRKDEARGLLEKAVAARPTDTSAAVALAALYGRIGERDKAEALLAERLKSAPDNAGLRIALAAFYQTSKKFDDAVREYEQVLTQRPNDAGVLNNLAWLYQQRGDLAKARQFAERAVALAPKSGVVEDTLGWILLAQGQPDQALSHLEAANAELPRNPTIQYHLAVALGRNGKSADARALLEQLLASGGTFEEKPEAEKLLQQLKNG